MWDVLEFKNLGEAIPLSALSFIKKLIQDLDRHDSATKAHCARVGEMALALSKSMGLSYYEQALCYYSGLLHDVGKMKIPAEVLNKPSRLTEEEYKIVKLHTDFGVELIEPLQDIKFFREVSQAVKYHHERVDGKGYAGLPEAEIPLVSKVILVVDTVDAMTEDRVYRRGVSLSAACDELVRCSGTQFDASIVDCFLLAVQKNQIAIQAQASQLAS